MKDKRPEPEMRTEGRVADAFRLSADSLRVEADRMGALAMNAPDLTLARACADYADLFTRTAREIERRLEAPK